MTRSPTPAEYSRAISAAAPQPRLTELSRGAGCACKLGAAELKSLLAGFPAERDPALLVGAATSDDAAVYRLTEELAIVQSADFFTPIVDDPRTFGRIAATNALSDLYAMGARPVLALNLVAYSIRDLGEDPLRQILAGSSEVAHAAGVAVGGGHSIDDPEPKFGLAVTGVAHPDRVLTNAAAQLDDELFLTKPIGGGLVTTAAKRGLAPMETIQASVDVMTELNREAADAAISAGAHAATDITGFGLLGHLHELCLASGMAAEVDASAVPIIDGVLDLAEDARCIAGGSRRNAAHAETFSTWATEVPASLRTALTDAMTSGGLLLAMPEDSVMPAPGTRIGRVTAGEPGHLRIV